jgi:hypothetical protein
MKTCVALACLALAVSALAALPPAQSDLTPDQLNRMKPEDRAVLDRRIGVGIPGLGADGTILSGAREDIETFDGLVVVLQGWSFRDASSVRAVEAVNESLSGLEGVRVVSVHGPEEPEKLQRVLERRPLPGVVVLDQSGALTGPLGLEARGANLIVDQKGVVRYAGVEAEAVRPLVQGLLDTPATEEPRIMLAELATQLAQSGRLSSDIEEAWLAGESKKAETLMEQLWQQAPAGAADITMALLTARDPVQRPLAVGLFARFGSRDQKLAAIRALDERRDSPEITILVRSLGGEDVEEPGKLLAPFLESRDLDVRQAALYALADSAPPTAIDAFVREMSNAPVASGSWGTSERERLMSAYFGVAYRLTGLRAQTGREVADWLATYRRDPEKAATLAERSITAENGQPNRVAFSSDEMLTFDGFDLGVRNEATGNRLPDEGLPALLADTAAKAAERAAPVLGVVYLPPLRVYLADDRGFASLASNSYMGGQAEVNQLILRLGTEEQVRQTMAHEWIHMLHQAVFDKTPRWLAEGVAQSLSSEERASVPVTVRRFALQDMIDKGIFTQLLTWQSGASSDSRESSNYAAAMLAVDFLRLGPFTAGDTRLNLLLGHISRGRGERDALERVYGMSTRDLDEAFRDWVAKP